MFNVHDGEKMKKQAKERTNEREPHIAGNDRRPFRAGRSAKVKYADDYGKQASERQAARSGTGDASPVWQRSVKVHPWPGPKNSACGAREVGRNDRTSCRPFTAVQTPLALDESLNFGKVAGSIQISRRRSMKSFGLPSSVKKSLSQCRKKS